MSWSFWQFVGVWLGLSTIPYAMFLVAYVFESRLPGIGPDRIPVWRYQSRAFLPGDFGLTLFVTSGLCLFDQASRGQRTLYEWINDQWQVVATYQLHDWSVSGWWQWLVAPMLSIIVLYVGRRVLYNKDDYTPAAWRSPTKRYHDYIMFGLFPLAVVWWVIPGYVAFFTGLMQPMSFSIGVVVGVGIGGFVGWMQCLSWDSRFGEVPNGYQHPSSWRPIWVTRRRLTRA